MDVAHPHRQSPDFEPLPTPQALSSSGQFHKEPHDLLLDNKDGTYGQEIAVSTKSSNTKQAPSILRSFIWETLCLALASASLLGLVGILRRYENKENPEWSAAHVGVTLNTVISIVSTLFRGSLLMPVAQSISRLCWTWYTQPRPLVDVYYYDSATRGALGSIRLLLRLRFLHFASLGALITIAALALDPFFQQTVRYKSQPAMDPSRQAQAAAAHTYDINKNFTGELFDAYQTLPYSMKAATYNGLLSSNLLSLPAPPFNCPTGNCTWDSFSTLAVRSQCVDLTSQVSLNCSASETCHFMAPNDPTLQSMFNGTCSGMYAPFYIESGLGQDFLPVLQSYANTTGFLSVVQWVKAFGVPQYLGYIEPNTTFDAGRCAFYFSVVDVQAQVENGVYSEKILQEYTRSENQPKTPTYTLNSTGTDFFFQNPFSFDFSDTLVYKPPFANTPPNLNDTFTVPYNSFDMVASLLTDGFVSGSVCTATSTLVANEFVGLLYEADNITIAMQNVAQYLTTEIRAASSNISQQNQNNTSIVTAQQAIIGTTWEQKQFVIVEWAWLTLPIVLLVLAIFSHLAAILETRRSSVGLWQSGPLTLFFHAQRSHDVKTLDPDKLNTADKMQNVAEHLRAQITNGARGTIEVYEGIDHHYNEE